MWGGIGVLFGLFLAGVGVVPLAIIAAAIAQLWQIVGSLAIGIAITFGARALATYLAQLIDKATLPHRAAGVLIANTDEGTNS